MIDWKPKAKEYYKWIWNNKIKTISVLAYAIIITAMCGVILRIIFESLEYIACFGMIGILAGLLYLVVKQILTKC